MTLEEVREWMRVNKLRLKLDKVEVLLVVPELAMGSG